MKPTKSQFYPLKVIGLEEQTKLAKCISLEVPESLAEEFLYKPGQFLTLKFSLASEEHRRSYSLCSSPIDKALQVGVKRVKGGIVSNHINDKVKVGDTIQVMAPNGLFFADVNKSQYKTYFLFAAGSGITPILSILRTVLKTEPNSYVQMLYGNSNQNTIMFKDELDSLKETYADRLLLVHTLSDAKSEWSDLWKSSNDKPFKKGRVDAEAVEWFITEHPPYAQDAEYYICGPGTMIETCKKTLIDLDVPKQRIFIENFSGAENNDGIKGFIDAKLTANLNGKKISTVITEGKTVLRSLIDAGYEPPYSCEGGVCSTCVCTLKNGQVHMKNNAALSKEEVEQGQILSCQSIPLTDDIEIHYQ